MLDIFHYHFMQHAVWASIIGGVSCALIGVFIVTMEIPFLGVAMSHAAFAGAIFGLLLKVNPIASAFLFCLIASFLIGPLSDRAGFNPDTATGILFSVMLGLAFLFLSYIPGSRNRALSLIWGSILTVSGGDIIRMVSSGLVLVSFIMLFFKEIRAVIFSRTIAASVGIPEHYIYYAVLVLSGLVITVNLTTIGGLLIFSLVINPAAAAFQLTYRLRSMFICSAAFGVVSCLAGLLFSYYWNVPAGAVIIIVSSFIFLVSLVFSPKKNTKSARRFLPWGRGASG